MNGDACFSLCVENTEFPSSSTFSRVIAVLSIFFCQATNHVFKVKKTGLGSGCSVNIGNIFIFIIFPSRKVHPMYRIVSYRYSWLWFNHTRRNDGCKCLLRFGLWCRYFRCITKSCGWIRSTV